MNMKKPMDALELLAQNKTKTTHKAQETDAFSACATTAQEADDADDHASLCNKEGLYCSSIGAIVAELRERLIIALACVLV